MRRSDQRFKRAQTYVQAQEESAVLLWHNFTTDALAFEKDRVELLHAKTSFHENLADYKKVC